VDNGLWWGAVGEDEWPKDPRSRAAILASMLPETGDRRQEIVFIGTAGDLVGEAVKEALDWALVDDSELFQYNVKLKGYRDNSAHPLTPVGDILEDQIADATTNEAWNLQQPDPKKPKVSPYFN